MGEIAATLFLFSLGAGVLLATAAVALFVVQVTKMVRDSNQVRERIGLGPFISIVVALVAYSIVGALKTSLPSNSIGAAFYRYLAVLAGLLTFVVGSAVVLLRARIPANRGSFKELRPDNRATPTESPRGEPSADANAPVPAVARGDTQPSASSRIVQGFLLAPLLALIATCLLSPGSLADASIWFIVALIVAYPATLCFAVPLFFLFAYFDWLRWWHCAIGGMLAAVPIAAFYHYDVHPSQAQYVPQIYIYVVTTGAACGVIFWFLAMKPVRRHPA